MVAMKIFLYLGCLILVSCKKRTPTQQEKYAHGNGEVGKEYAVKGPLDVKGCSFDVYSPAGRVKLSKLKAPVAKLANDMMSNILSHVSEATGIGAEVLNAASVAFKFWENVSPYLGPVIGIIGATTGIISDQMSPSPSDILGAANTAIAKLTNDMNNKLDDLKGYVDNEIIRAEKEFVTREYKTKFNLFTYCVSEPNKDLSTECQRDVYRDIGTSLPKFAVFADELLSSHPLTSIQAKRVESYLVAFRNYADLVVSSLIPLVQLYKEDKSAVGRAYYKRYSMELKQKSEMFIKYSKAAVSAVMKMHNSINSCDKSFKCAKEKEEDGYDKYECDCIIDDGSRQRCQITGLIRSDKVPRGATKWYYGSKHDNAAGMDNWARFKLYKSIYGTSLAELFSDKQNPIIEAYWQKELLDSIPNWEKAIEIANPGTKVKDAADANLPDEYSPRHKYRVKFVQKYPYFY